MRSSRVCSVLAAGAFAFAAMALTAPAAVATPFSDACVITHGWNSVVVAAGIEECHWQDQATGNEWIKTNPLPPNPKNPPTAIAPPPLSRG
jgi:hypothetical protein